MSKSVLLVEDNPDDQLLALYALKKNGLGEEEVAVARGGAEALDYLFGERAGRGDDGLPRLVLLDQRLPGVDGPEVLRRLRADDRTASLPVVMLTAVDLPEIPDDYGAWALLRKPLTSKKLAEVARKLGVRGLLSVEAAQQEKQAVISKPARAVSQGDRPLRVLLIEDSEDDAALILRALRRGGHKPVHRRVATHAGMEAALAEEEWDVLVSDYHLPDFDAMEALEIAKESGLDLPFIVVSGKIGEDVAVELMRAGAHDYITKFNLSRLGPAVEREVREAQGRRERRRAEAALRGSEHRFRSLVQNSSDITIVLDARGTILYESPAVERVLGYTPEERIGRNILDLVHPGDVERVSDALARSLEEPGVRLLIEYRVQHKDGPWRHFEAISNNLLSDPIVKGIVVNSRDITDRKRAEEELEESEELYRTVVEQAAESIFLVDLDTKRILEANAALHRSLGYAEGELQQITLYDIVAHDRESIDLNIRRLVEAGSSFLGERLHCRKDGSLMNVEVNASTISYSGKEAMCIVARDVTERKLAEQRRNVQYTTSRVLAESGGLKEAAPRLLEAIGANLGWGLGLLWMVDQSAGVLRCEEVWHAHSVVAAEFEAARREINYTPGCGLPGRVWKSGEPLWIPDVLEDATLRQPKSAAREGLHGFFAFPIQDEGHLLGVIEFFCQRILPPDEDLLQTVTTLGNQIGQFVERKRKEQALWESEERFRGIFEQAAVGVALVGMDGRWLRVNRKLCDIVGYSWEELLALTFQDITHPDDLDTDLEYLSHLLSGEIYPYYMEKRYVRKDGSIIWIGLTVSPGREPSGESEYLISVIEDITERKRAERALKESEERFRSLVQNASDVITVLEADGSVRYESPAIERVMGYQPEEMVGKNVFDYVHPEDLEHLSSVFGEKVPNGQEIQTNIEVRFRHADGSWRQLEAVINNLLEDPSVAGIVVNSRDITERKRVEESLRHTLGMLLALYEASQMMNSTLNLEERGARLLETMHRVAAFTVAVINLRDERGQLRVWKATGPEDVWGPAYDTPEARAARRSALEDGGIQVFRLQGAGPEGPPLGLCLPLRAQGQVIGNLEAFGPETLTEKRTVDVLASLVGLAGSALESARLYGELAEREHRLEELIGKLMTAQEEERRRVAYEVHDGLAQVAAAAHQHLQAFARLYPPDSEESQHILYQALELVQQTVRDARRIIANLRPTTLDDFGLQAAVRLEVEALREEDWQISFEGTLREDERLPFAVETALFRIIQEALTNIRKHSNSKQVRLSLDRLEKSIRLSVQDWGQGFDPAALADGGGPGERVGLSSMRERVALLGGVFQINSYPGAGTLVTVDVPLPKQREADHKTNDAE